MKVKNSIEIKEKINMPFLIAITMVSAMRGLLFGYD